MMNKTQEELLSASDIAKADDIELQEIVENASRKHRESQPASPRRTHQGFAHVRTSRFG